MNINSDNEIVHEVKVFRNFRIHLSIYIVIMACIWLIYWLRGGVISLYTWPVYLSMAWGFIVALHLLVAYRAFRNSKI